VFGSAKELQETETAIFMCPKIKLPTLDNEILVGLQADPENELRIFCSFEQTRDYIRSDDFDPVVFKELVRDDEHQDICFLTKEGLLECINDKNRYSIVLTVLYRLFQTKCFFDSQETHGAFVMQRYIDAHINLVSFLCRTDDISDEALEQKTLVSKDPHVGILSNFEYYMPTQQNVYDITRCPDISTMLSFLVFGSYIKAKLDSIYYIIAHCFLFKVLNQKCTNRNLIPMLCRMFVKYPFMRAYTRLLLTVFMLGNFPGCSERVSFCGRMKIYELFDVNNMTNDEFNEWLTANHYLVELFFREHQIWLIERTVIFDVYFHYKNVNPSKINNWIWVKKSTRHQANIVRRLLSSQREGILEYINNILKDNHMYDLKYPLFKDNQISLLDRLIEKLQIDFIPDGDSEIFEQLQTRVETLCFVLQQRNVRPKNPVERLYMQDHPLELLLPKTNCCQWSPVENLPLCNRCGSLLLKALLVYRDALESYDILLDRETFVNQINAFRKKNFLFPWESMNGDFVKAFYSESDDVTYWVSSSYQHVKRNNFTLVMSSALKKCSYNYETDQIIFQKDKLHSVPLKFKYILGRIVSTKSKKWVVCIECGLVIMFSAYCISSKGMTCPFHNVLNVCSNAEVENNPEYSSIHKFYSKLIAPQNALTSTENSIFVLNDKDDNDEEAAEQKLQEFDDVRLLMKDETTKYCEDPIFNDMLNEYYEEKNTLAAPPLTKKGLKRKESASRFAYECFFCGVKETKKKVLRKFKAKKDLNVGEYTVCAKHENPISRCINSTDQYYDVEELRRMIHNHFFYSHTKYSAMNKFY
jgi:hypothetical protein